ncbi:MAG: L-rhamnose mutarotase [Candidatus Pseudobacter hemicellulosilyticus]|uniref:L-rhamnose mutarotase n=1 Tax=Candidatus Pseudobacter hemicellulosilyticus TaxID=3121375 RepID=A0AAJ5WSK8_9BACT|nr:MAG: L-rhamnose mutarotase [Pseudobacter sp.]
MAVAQRYCLALDLKNDPAVIAAYEAHHRTVWPEILASIRAAGIEQMEIYRTGNRLFMIMGVNDQFSFNKQQQADAANPKVQEWEALMWSYQQALPAAAPGVKWVLMDRIFEL